MSGLTDPERREVVRYNRSQGFSDEVARIIQGVVRTPRVDGVLGPNTADRIHAWQAEPMTEDLPKKGTPRMPVADGKMGTNSLGRMAGELLYRGDVLQAEPLLRWLRAELEEGNDRWRRGSPEHPHQGFSRTEALTADQRPFVVALTCIDSRVPTELVFDRGVGEMFIVRTAGQILDRAVIGSIQYALSKRLTPIVVVLGHEDCGAVKAKAIVDQLEGDLRWLVEQVDTGPFEPTTVEGAEANALKVRDALRRNSDVGPWLKVEGQALWGVYRPWTRGVDL